MIRIPLFYGRQAGGERLIVDFSLKDAKGILGPVSAIVDTGCPFTMIFGTGLKRFRRMKIEETGTPEYMSLGATRFQKKQVSGVAFCFRDEDNNLHDCVHELLAGVHYEKGVLSREFFEMIVGLDFLKKHNAVLDLRDSEKPVLLLQVLA
ncbi:hypothetical protein HZC09_06230 [Candidatus Micrarchaeota archaeon]|nr:hypothetical protein [Candidatus Micrarchaeota archaeon]